jgi:dihydroflavonol-4-reductase
MPSTPRMHFGVVDVHDVADLHLRAMTHPDAAGERFIASAGEPFSLHELAVILHEHLRTAGRAVPRMVLPTWLIRLAGLGDANLKQIAREAGHIRRSSSDKAHRILGWLPRAPQTTITDTADSLIKLDLIGKWRRSSS